MHTLSAEFLGNQNQTAQVFCQGPGVVSWERLDDPIVPINTNTAKYRGIGNRLDIFNVVGGDEAQYRCSYTDQGTDQLITEPSCVFVLGQFSSVCGSVLDVLDSYDCVKF